MNRLPKLLLMALLPTVASADIVTDGSLGAATSLTGPDFAITADLGQERGGNLFHSFSRFNIPTNGSATFSGPAEIANIISRITGGELSSIDGLLRSDILGANLFLLNPAGVIFGPNASLDISGSLHISSADYLALGEEMVQFLATPMASDVLSTAAPVAFGFLGSNAGAIQIQGSELTLSSGNTLTLAANGIELDNAEVEIDRGQVSLVAIGGAGEVDIETGEANVIDVYADINIVEQSAIFANSVTIRGNDINLNNNIDIDISVYGADDAGNIVIEATNEIAISDSSLLVVSEGEGNAGSIDIKTHRLHLSGAYIDGGAFGQGAGGNLAVQAAEIAIRDNTIIFTDSLDKGNGGSINLQITDEVAITESQLIARSSDQGNAGSIDIATDRLHLDGAEINASTSSKGDGGLISIDVQALELRNGGKIQAATFSTGDGGAIDIKVDQLLIDRNDSDSSTGIFGNAETGSSGSAGDLSINAESIELLNGGEIESNTRGSGNAGFITVEADRLLINRNGSGSSTGIFGRARSGSSGAAGDLLINAKTIELLDGGLISGSIFGSGDGGTVAVVSDRLSIDAMDAELTGIFSSAGASSTGGDGGLIFIDVQALELRNGGKIQAATFSTGDGGAIDIKAEQLLIDRNDSDSSTGIFGNAETGSSGSAGDLSINAQSIELLNGGEIESNTRGSGNAGFITVEADRLLIDRNDSDSSTGIFGRARSGSSGAAGNLLINAKTIELLDGGLISGSIFGSGDGGTVAVVSDRLSIDAMDGELTGIFSSAGASSTGGDGGLIFIDVQALELRNGGKIQAATFSTGDGGTIEIKADQLLIDRNDFSTSTGIFGSAASTSTGDAGSIDIKAGEIQILGSRSLIDTSANASGNAGNIGIDSGTLTLADGGSIFSENTGTGWAGSISIDVAGDVTINNGSSINTETIDGSDPEQLQLASIQLKAQNLLLAQGSTITTSASGTADAGYINVQTTDSIRLFDNSALSTESVGGGGGRITVLTKELLYLQNSNITTSVGLGGGNGGDIFVDPIFIVLDNSAITANAIDGNGGNITLVGDYINQSVDSRITASSQLGVNGEITIDAFDTQVEAGENSLSADFLDASKWQRQACAQRSGSDVSSFIVEQRPLRPAPHDDWSVSREL